MEKMFAKFLYEQCAGTTNGHMARIPNNPVLFSLIKVHFPDSRDDTYACSLTEFGKFMLECADCILEQ